MSELWRRRAVARQICLDRLLWVGCRPSKVPKAAVQAEYRVNGSNQRDTGHWIWSASPAAMADDQPPENIRPTVASSAEADIRPADRFGRQCGGKLIFNGHHPDRQFFGFRHRTTAVTLVCYWG